MLNKIKKAIDDIGYTNQNIENKNKGLATFFLEGEFIAQDIEDEMYEMTQDMDDVYYYDTVIACEERGDGINGAFITFKDRVVL